MIFQYTHKWVTGVSPYTGKPKTTTSRLMKPGETFSDLRTVRSPGKVGMYTRYQIGREYGVHPERGAKSVARIRILDIAPYDVRNITPEMVAAEGFDSWYHFMNVWIVMYCKDLHGKLLAREYTSVPLREIVSENKDNSNFMAWYLMFELVERIDRGT